MTTQLQPAALASAMAKRIQSVRNFLIGDLQYAALWVPLPPRPLPTFRVPSGPDEEQQ